MPGRIADLRRRLSAAGAAATAAVLLVLAVLELAFWWPADAPEPVTGWAYALAVAMTAPLVARRQRPDLVMTIVGGAGIVAPAFGVAMPTAATFGILVALYSIAAHGTHKDAVASGVVTFAVLVYVAWRYWEYTGIAGTAANYLLFGTAWALGYAARNRRLLLHELQARAEAAERTREEEALRAVADERARIARELHDVVAHTVSVMVVQAGAARRLLDRDPAAAGDAVTAVEQTGRSALAELRRLLGVLRSEQAATGARTPQPTLQALPALVQTLRAAGMPVEAVVEGAVDDLPPGLDVSAYRIVQEALTNVLKHAGPTTRVAVRVRRDERAVVVEVDDDGQGAAAPDGKGHGVVGMRERVALYGGQLDAGPKRDGGYRVRARLPLATEAVEAPA